MCLIQWDSVEFLPLSAWRMARGKLFALFLNDLEDFMEARSCSGISQEFVLEELYFYLKLFVQLYADDTVIFGTDETCFPK